MNEFENNQITDEVCDVPSIDTSAEITLVKREDGIHVIDDGVEGEACTRKTPDGFYYLTKNSANRKFYSVKKADAMAEGEIVTLAYKASRHFDGTSATSARIPNQALIKYLSEEEQAEYLAIVNRAKEAMAAAKAANKKKPLTEEEKIKARIEKLMAQLNELNKGDEE